MAVNVVVRTSAEAAWAAGILRTGDTVAAMYDEPELLDGLSGRKLIGITLASETAAAIAVCQAQGITWLTAHLERPDPPDAETAIVQQQDIYSQCQAAGISLLYSPQGGWFQTWYPQMMLYCDALIWPAQGGQAGSDWPDGIANIVRLAQAERPGIEFGMQVSATPPADPTRTAAEVLTDMVQIYWDGVRLDHFAVFFQLADAAKGQQIVEDWIALEEYAGNMSLQLSTIANSIAALSISGVTVLDIDQVPVSAERLGPVLFPKPDGYLSGFTVERNSTGSGGTQKLTVRYTLTYRFCHSPVGQGRIFDAYDDMVTKAGLILDAILANDAITGLVDLEASGVLAFGPVSDPAGNMYHGFDLALRVMEFVN